jgi:selenocysteine lyase/cysteine desulfurase
MLTYKFFIGVLYGKRQHLESLPAYKVRPAPDAIPERWETGTKNHEGIAGTLAAIEYLDWIGEEFGKPYSNEVKGYGGGRRRRLKLAMHAIKDYEKTLSARLLDGLRGIKNVTVAGITDKSLLDYRLPTIIFTVKGMAPAHVASEMGKRGIYVWDGNYYALEVMERLGRESYGGMVRVGAAHYNNVREINRFLKALKEIASNGLKVIEGGKSQSTTDKSAPKKKTGTRRTRQPAKQARATGRRPDLSA